MSTHSTDGREWAKYSALKEGDRVIADGGFTCIPEGAVRVVKAAGNGELYVACGGCGSRTKKSDKHFLDGQLDEPDADHLVGFWPAPAIGVAA